MALLAPVRQALGSCGGAFGPLINTRVRGLHHTASLGKRLSRFSQPESLTAVQPVVQYTPLGPPAASTVYDRRNLDDGSEFRSRVPLTAPTSFVPVAEADLPPALRPPRQKRERLTTAQVKEMQRLRAEDPKTWNQKRLSEAFGCSRYFVAIAAPAPKGHIETLCQEYEDAWANMGWKQRLIKLNRVKRRALW
ncbi:hypothetical protein H4R34_003154 [Dimargaris verticillata]|uniref:Mitochondrial ribosomal protein subunit L20-domain-containing protein n=1 Tax=Dimargaris verticillata TaxID=2761393 RepID=A0A9W8B821_9FUNG|nr:hypothetical protein H4R34_003154 [Dimargaris verticillata]